MSKRHAGNKDGSSGTGESPARSKAKDGGSTPTHLRGSPPSRTPDGDAAAEETCSPSGSAAVHCAARTEDVSSRRCACVRQRPSKIGAPQRPGQKPVEEQMLPLSRDKIVDLLTDQPHRPFPALSQIDVDSLFLTQCMPSTVDYVLGALLLGAQLGGDAANVKQWVLACRRYQQNKHAEWRNQLAQAYNLRCGGLLSRVQHIFQRWANVEVEEVAIETYCTQVARGQRTKMVNRKSRNRGRSAQRARSRSRCPRSRPGRSVS